jgi:hypothetical protein
MLRLEVNDVPPVHNGALDQAGEITEKPGLESRKVHSVHPN